MAWLAEGMRARGIQALTGSTGLLIAPGYSLKVAEGLITNFHQPNSTLLLLVAAVIGDDWKKVYTHALENGYRFLSYGDSSLLERK
jgi:S-adenosylmethionine:tRNA ribosyltransferase-isomerase